MSNTMMNLKEFYAPMEFKWYVVEVEAGPRRRPTHKAKHYMRARSGTRAIEAIKRTVHTRLRSARFSARYAHPTVDLGFKCVKNFTPADPAAPLPAALRSTQGMYQITCRCGHADDFDRFTSTPSGVSLPRNEYQCPKCYKAWRIEAIGEGWTAPSGMFVPPERKCVAILPRQ